MNTLGENIKYYRNISGYTQETLTKTLRNKYNLRVTRPTISRWESGEQTPSIYYLKCLSETFDISLDTLCDTKSDYIKVIAADTMSSSPTVISTTPKVDPLQQKRNILADRIKNSDYTNEELDKIEQMLNLVIYR